MASGWTNKGRTNVLGIALRGQTPPANFYIALITNAVVPTADTNTFSELTEIAAGNGYTAGGISVARNTTDWDTLTESDASDYAMAQLKDEAWTASGGALPASGSGASYAILTDANATQGSREVWYFWDLSEARQVSSGQPLTLQNCEVRIA